MEDLNEQRPQRTGYSDLNERQREGVPAIEADEAEGKPTQLPDLGSSNVEATPDETSEPARESETSAPIDRNAPDERRPA